MITHPKVLRFLHHHGGIVLVVFVWALAAFAPSRVNAQAVYGSVSGVVTDSTGAVVPGATVTVTSAERKTSDTVVTNESGNYVKERLLEAYRRKHAGAAWRRTLPWAMAVAAAALLFAVLRPHPSTAFRRAATAPHRDHPFRSA